MPQLPPTFLTSLRRGGVGFGRALRPAVGPIAIGGAALIGLHGVQLALDSYGKVQNPPAQTGTIPYGTPNPNDGQGGEAGFFFDPRTGRSFFFGDPPNEGSGPERSDERVTKTALIAGAAAIAAIAFIVMNTRRK